VCGPGSRPSSTRVRSTVVVAGKYTRTRQAPFLGRRRP
jgi:hypothetical protein